MPILPVAAVLGLGVIGVGLWMSGLLERADTAPQRAAAPVAAPAPEPETAAPETTAEPIAEAQTDTPPPPAGADPQMQQSWLDARIAEGPPAPCTWLPRGSTVAALSAFAADPAALAALQRDFEAEFDQPLALTLHPLAEAQCPAFERIAALDHGRPPAGRMGFTLPDQLPRSPDAVLEGQLAGQVSGHLSVLMIDPAGRVQHITDLISAGEFTLSGARLAAPEDALGQGAAPPVFALLALDTDAPLPIMQALPSNAILPAHNAEEFWTLLARDLDALAEAPDVAHGIVPWTD